MLLSVLPNAQHSGGYLQWRNISISLIAADARSEAAEPEFTAWAAKFRGMGTTSVGQAGRLDLPIQRFPQALFFSCDTCPL